MLRKLLYNLSDVNSYRCMRNIVQYVLKEVSTARFLYISFVLYIEKVQFILFLLDCKYSTYYKSYLAFTNH